MSKHEFDERMDEAIDRAVRQMMSAEPRPGFRARVFGRMQRPARSGWSWLTRGAAAGLPIAALLLAVLYLGSAPAPVQPPDAPVIAQAPTAPPASPLPSAADAGARETGEPVPQPPAARVERLAPPPKMDDVFGGRPDGRVTAATVNPGAAPSDGPPPLTLAPLSTGDVPQDAAQAKAGAADTAKPPAARPAPQLVNIRIELSLIEEGDGAAPPKTVRMLVADQQQGRVRSGGPSSQTLNLDARPELVAGGRIRVHLTLEYRPDGTSPQMLQSLAAVLDNGTPLPITQSTDPAGNRVVRAELTATIVK